MNVIVDTIPKVVLWDYTHNDYLEINYNQPIDTCPRTIVNRKTIISSTLRKSLKDKIY